MGVICLFIVTVLEIKAENIGEPSQSYKQQIIKVVRDKMCDGHCGAQPHAHGGWDRQQGRHFKSDTPQKLK